MKRGVLTANRLAAAAWTSAGACETTRSRRLRGLRLSLVCALLVVALDGAAEARSGSGYGDKIDSYCIDRGRLRVRTHQGHCAACHHLGTFDSAPEHRVEPNWTEFERGRSGAGFDFFCPGTSGSSQMPKSAAPEQRPEVGPGGASTIPQIEPRAGAMGMPPAIAAKPGLAKTPPAVAPDVSGQAVAVPVEQAQPNSPIQSTARLPIAEFTDRLKTLHDTVGIKPGQEPAWREFVDAMAAATQRKGVASGAIDPTARLKARERDLSERIVALRAAGIALSRLGAVLDDTQRRAVSEGVGPLLDSI